MLSAKMGSAGLTTGTRVAKGLLTAIGAANTVGADLHVITAPRVANLPLGPAMTESNQIRYLVVEMQGFSFATLLN
jgi:hypothetical protein